MSIYNYVDTTHHSEEIAYTWDYKYFKQFFKYSTVKKNNERHVNIISLNCFSWNMLNSGENFDNHGISFHMWS